HLSENKANLETELNEKKLAKERAYKTLDTEQKKLVEVTEKHQTILKNIHKLEAQLQETGEELSDQLEELKSDYIEKLNEQAVKKNELNSSTNRIEQLRNINESASLDQEDKLKEREIAKEKLNNLIDKIKNENNKLTEINKKSENEKNKLKQKELKYEEMRDKLQEANETIARLTARKETLEEMRDSYQGYFFGVKEVLKAAEHKELSNIHGVVLDLIDIPKAYITAIDTVLGGQAQNIVVQNDIAARNTINWLKKENKGRATFLPLESIKERLIQNKNQASFIEKAKSIIQTDYKYQKLVNYLLGNIIVAKTLKDANHLAKLTEKKYRIVTLDGDLVFPGGSMSGGAKRKGNQSLF